MVSTYEEALALSQEYFGDDDLAPKVFLDKYALRDADGNLLEQTPDQMHRRLAKEFARIENKYPNPMSEEEIFEALDRFKYIVPQGSPMSAIGNNVQLQTVGNCFLPGTKVHTSCGIKNIEDIQIGDLVVTHKNRLRPVAQTHKNLLGNRQIYEFKCYRTPAIKVTENHEFMSISKEQLKWGQKPKFNSIQYLRVGDYIQIPNNEDVGKNVDFNLSSLFDDHFQYYGKKYEVERNNGKIRLVTVCKGGGRKSHKYFIPQVIKADNDFAYFIGLWYGDGCIFGENLHSNISCKRNRRTKLPTKIRGITFTFGAHEFKLISFVTKYLNKLEIPFKLNNNNDIDGTVQIVVHSPILGYSFEKLFGRRFDGKRLNSTMFNWTKDNIISFAQGLIDSDGTVTSKGDVRVVLSNKSLIKQVYHLLRSRNQLVGYSEAKRTARLDFGRNDLFRNASKKTYSDNRINALLSNKTSHQIQIDGNTYVEILSKVCSNETPDFVYTFGVEEDHSYSVEGLLAMNCYVIDSPEDSYGGIFRADQEEAQIMKRRGGVGMDISNIRPKGMRTKNAARTTEGISIFMERFSNTCREVGIAGRRGALLLTIDCHHPEIRTFVNIKRDLAKVTGANISIRWSDEFLKAVENNSDVQLRFPVDPNLSSYQVEEKVNAKEIWDEFVDSAHASGEPGCLYWDTILKQSPADIYSEEGFKTRSANPCIVGDTLVAVADGRNAVKIKDLVDEGKEVPVYSTNPTTGKVEIKKGYNFIKTGERKEVWRLELDDGSELIATPDHRILTKSLEYVELKDLKPGTSLAPFNSFNSNGYRQISHSGKKMMGGARRNRRQYRLIHEFYSGDKTDAKNFAIHHKDFNSLNDSYANLMIMSHDEHRKLHAEKMMGKRNPYHRMTNEWKLKFASHPGETNGRYSGHTNEELIEHGRKVLKENGQFTIGLWQSYAKKHGLPQHVANKFRFGKFSNFKSQVIENHKVVSVEFYGYEDVYDCTVEDNHNFCIITSSNDTDFVNTSGVTIHNCGEITMNADSCRLLLLNAFSFVRNPFQKSAKFEYAKFRKYVIMAQRLMDDLVDIEIEKIDKIIDKVQNDPEEDEVKRIEINLWKKFRKNCERGRRTGLGLTGIGDTLAALGIRFGSDESIKKVERIYKTLCLSAYESSYILGGERGAFPIFNHEKEIGHPFIEQIWKANPKLKALSKKNGRRNIALTTTAPCGSVSILTQTTSGIEPVFLTHYKRRKKINPSDENARVDFKDQMGDSWQEFDVYHHGIKKWMEVTGETDISKSPYAGAAANEIDWVGGVKLQAAAQKWICHAISRTTNLPNNVDKQVVNDVYLEGWKSGCKGVTVYRDGCRSGVLVSDTEEKEEADLSGRPAQIVHTQAPKRPEELPCEIYHATVNKMRWTILVGMLEDQPYEIFTGYSEDLEIPNKCRFGKIVKVKPGHYNLHVDIGGEEFVIKNMANKFVNPDSAWATRIVSAALRHGTPVDFLVEQLQKEGGMGDINKVIARLLKKFIKDGQKVRSSHSCPACESNDLAYMEGCITCQSCGWSRC